MWLYAGRMSDVRHVRASDVGVGRHFCCCSGCCCGCHYPSFMGRIRVVSVDRKHGTRAVGVYARIWTRTRVNERAIFLLFFFNSRTLRYWTIIGSNFVARRARETKGNDLLILTQPRRRISAYRFSTCTPALYHTET